MVSQIPQTVRNWVAGREVDAADGATLAKLSPAEGSELCQFARSRAADVDAAVAAARGAFAEWAATTPVRRGEILRNVALAMREHRDELAHVVALETGKAPSEAAGETNAAFELGMFMAGEGTRLYGRTTTSGVPGKQASTIRQPLGVAGLIIAANTPIANVAWKVFPALICGNAAVLKAAEDTPATAWLFAKLAHQAGLPPGVLNVIQGLGEEAGAPLVSHDDVEVISFTGSTQVGRQVASVVGERLGRVSLELGGKNPLVVCDDADLEQAADWTVRSAFSNAGQRCASGSRVIIFDSVYEPFREILIAKTKALSVGPSDGDDLGPVINESQLNNMLRTLEGARAAGATILIGGERLTGERHAGGFYLAPTLVEHAKPDAEISASELFGPIACLYRVADFGEALALANDSPYGLTACIHTRSVDRALRFTQEVEAGVAVVNGGTYGSEPHMPFGGVKASGNGWREPGTEALDVYSNLKDIYLCVDFDRA